MTVIFPGSFDPFTAGHEALVLRALSLFNKVIIAVGNNSDKKYMFNIDNRINIIRSAFKDNKKIEVEHYDGLTIDLCRKHKVFFLLRGLRTSADFEFERAIGQINKQMEPQIETIFMLIAPEHSAISSSIVRDIIINNGDVSNFIPGSVSIVDFKRNF